MAACKACRPRTELTEEMIARAVETLCRDGAHTPADAPTVAARLQCCQACPHLESGHTCRVCGCFVPIRARIREFACPDAVADRWTMSCAVMP